MKILKKCPVTIILAVICLVFAVATLFDGRMYDLFADHSRPHYIWQYFSGTFMHGYRGGPVWFCLFHLAGNLLMLIPFGIILEKEKGSGFAFWVFFAATVASSLLFQVSMSGKDATGTGISAVGYAFVAGGIICLIRNWKSYPVLLRIVYLFLFALYMMLLSPAITGWYTTFAHLSGIAAYVIVHLIDLLISRSNRKSVSESK